MVPVSSSTSILPTQNPSILILTLIRTRTPSTLTLTLLILIPSQRVVHHR